MCMNEDLSSDYISTGSASKLCRNYGEPMSNTTLYMQGLKHGFARKSEDGFHWEFNRARLIQYLKEKMKKPPEGWISMLEASQISGLSINGTYDFINRTQLTLKSYGPRSLKYVEEKAFLSAWENRKSFTPDYAKGLNNE